MKRGWLFIPHAITKQCWTIILSSHQDSNAEGSFVKPKWAPWKFSQTLFYTLFYPRKLKVSLQRRGNVSLFSLQISVRTHPKWSNQWNAEVPLLFIRGSESHHQPLMAITWSQSLKFQLSNTRTPLLMYESCCRVPGEIPHQQSRLPYCAPGQGSGGQPIPGVAKAWLMVADQRPPQKPLLPSPLTGHILHFIVLPSMQHCSSYSLEKKNEEYTERTIRGKWTETLKRCWLIIRNKESLPHTQHFKTPAHLLFYQITFQYPVISLSPYCR